MMMTLQSMIALLRSYGFRVRRTSVRINDRPAYRLQFPGERYERPAYYDKEDMYMVLAGDYR